MSQLYLGTREVTPAIYKDAGVKYNATIDNFLGDIDSNGVYTRPQTPADLIFYGVKSIGSEGMKYFLNAYPRAKSIVFPDLENVTSYHCWYQAFTGASTLTSFSCPKLKTIGSYCAYSAFASTNIKVVNFEALETVESNGLNNAFYEAHAEEVYFPKLSSIGPSGLLRLLRNCSTFNNKSLSFPALKSTSFGTYTNQFNQMLVGLTGVTVHFPSNLQSVIGSWSDVTSGFSGTNTTILFDLTATE